MEKILNEFALLFALHIDEINIMAAHLFRNQSLFGPSHNSPNELANSMLVFLLTTLTGKKIAINLCSKPVHNLKHECLHQILLSSLDKAARCGFEMLPITMDGASTNVKVARMLLKELSVKVAGKATPTVQLKLKTSFIYVCEEIV